MPGWRNRTNWGLCFLRVKSIPVLKHPKGIYRIANETSFESILKYHIRVQFGLDSTMNHIWSYLERKKKNQITFQMSYSVCKKRQPYLISVTNLPGNCEESLIFLTRIWTTFKLLSWKESHVFHKVSFGTRPVPVYYLIHYFLQFPHHFLYL